MFMLVTVPRTKAALNIDTTDDDTVKLPLLISAASLAVHAYLKGQAGDLLSIDSPPNSPPNDLDGVDERVAISVIVLVGILYREPDGDEAKNFSHGNLPWIVTALLYPLRDPALA